MNKLIVVSFLTLWSVKATFAQQQLKAGDHLNNLVLNNVDDRSYDLNAQKGVKGFLLVFMSNTCDYCIMYKDRIIALDKKYKPLGYPVIGISPYGDDSVKYPLDAMPEMKKWVAEKHITFPYLADQKLKYSQLFGIKFTPEVVILTKTVGGYDIKYIGRIDNDPMLKKKQPVKIVENELAKIL